MSPYLNILVISVGALALLLLVRAFGWAKRHWPGFGIWMDEQPLLGRVLFIMAAAGIGLTLERVGAVLTPALAAYLPNTLEALLLSAGGGILATGAFAQGRKQP